MEIASHRPGRHLRQAESGGKKLQTPRQPQTRTPLKSSSLGQTTASTSLVTANQQRQFDKTVQQMAKMEERVKNAMLQQRQDVLTQRTQLLKDQQDLESVDKLIANTKGAIARLEKSLQQKKQKKVELQSQIHKAAEVYADVGTMQTNERKKMNKFQDRSRKVIGLQNKHHGINSLPAVTRFKTTTKVSMFDSVVP
uniref:Uncharacterized protein n=1 Tax=Fibrocapsa japonica TaxID=94617 RepID=A0A7S2UUA9_9STRA|mmetsp:Transcript_13842/g.20393  ORF Transcript_13842/g.20393 Transcript_13842/m.20393 type:complete len:196 (+) Transcript_13842:196-783(+)